MLSRPVLADVVQVKYVVKTGIIQRIALKRPSWMIIYEFYFNFINVKLLLNQAYIKLLLPHLLQNQFKSKSSEITKTSLSIHGKHILKILKFITSRIVGITQHKRNEMTKSPSWL